MTHGETTMIKEAYCSCEISNLLKEKGFDEKTLTYFDDDLLCHGGWFEWNRSPLGHIAAPTHQMVCAWLREVYNIDIITFHEKLPNDCYWARIERDLSTEFEQEPEYNSYEDAVESAIKYCLENLI